MQYQFGGVKGEGGCARERGLECRQTRQVLLFFKAIGTRVLESRSSDGRPPLNCSVFIWSFELCELDMQCSVVEQKSQV